ncbi:MAG: hypothetical protein MJ071_04715 [Oscillospiraceae bacterium]|nr:hypothetical protein [Oscillospiraceae bacterium]
MKCQNCQGDIREYDVVCPYCGIPLQSPAEKKDAANSAEFHSSEIKGTVFAPAGTQNHRFILIVAAVPVLFLAGGVIMGGMLVRSLMTPSDERTPVVVSEAEESVYADAADGFAAFPENVTAEDMILPGIHAGMNDKEVREAMAAFYPEMPYRSSEWVEDDEYTNYYATQGEDKLSLYGVENHAMYDVVFDDCGNADFAQLTIGAVYAREEGEVVHYAPCTAAKIQEQFGQLKASMDAAFSVGTEYDPSVDEIKKCYSYSPSEDTFMLLCYREYVSNNDSMLYEVAVMYYYFG